jgi:hypothetical protein
VLHPPREARVEAEARRGAVESDGNVLGVVGSTPAEMFGDRPGAPLQRRSVVARDDRIKGRWRR